MRHFELEGCQSQNFVLWLMRKTLEIQFNHLLHDCLTMSPFGYKHLLRNTITCDKGWLVSSYFDEMKALS